MSAQQQIYKEAIIAARRNTALPQSIFNRSFRRVLALLGLSATAAATWYGAWKLYQWYNFKNGLVGSSSDVFNVENINAETISSVVDVDEKDSIPFQGIDYDLRRQTVKVTLHQCRRGYYTPSIAPFPLKLETFLRVANIPYEIDFSGSPQNKTSPWMAVDGVDITESHECVPLLCSIFGIDLEKSANQKSRLTASRLVGIMLDNHIYWGIALWRWVYDAGRSLKVIQPLSSVGQDVVAEVSASVTRASWYHGLGRLSQEQVIELVLVDLSDLSAALGNHDFFLGNLPGEVDCNAFAMLSQMVWNMPESPFELALKKYPNLVDFVLRMRQLYWPDWNELLQKPGDIELPDKLFYPTGEFKVSKGQIPVVENKENVPNSSLNANTEEIKTVEVPISLLAVKEGEHFETLPQVSPSLDQLPKNYESQLDEPASKRTVPPQAQLSVPQHSSPQPSTLEQSTVAYDPGQQKFMSNSSVSQRYTFQQSVPHPQNVTHPASASIAQQIISRPQSTAQPQRSNVPQYPVQQHVPYKLPAVLPIYAQPFIQSTIYPKMGMNGPVIGHDLKFSEEDELFQQHLSGLNNLKHNDKMAQFSGLIQDTSALEAAQQQTATEQQYYQMNSNQQYQNPVQYDLPQIGYQSVNEQYEQMRPSTQGYLGNNPFIPNEQIEILPDHVLTGIHTLPVRNPHYGQGQFNWY